MVRVPVSNEEGYGSLAMACGVAVYVHAQYYRQAAKNGDNL